MAGSVLLRSALYYKNKLGFSVIPVAPGKKSPPLVDWEKYQHELPTDEEIKKWWTDSPKANIAIVTGRISNLVVADFDKYDPKYSEDTALEYFPDTLLTPACETPQGGSHLYFSYPDVDMRNNARALPGIDLRAEGGYVLAPPSVNGNGKAYEWSIDPTKAPLAEVPEVYILYINNIYKNSLYACDIKDSPLHGVTSVTGCDISFTKGTRDQDLFHSANCLIKGGMEIPTVRHILKILAQTCDPPFPASEVEIKVKSALERAERKERNIQAEVDSFIAVTSGYFSVTDCYHSINAVTTGDKSAVRQAVLRRKDVSIERVGAKDGVYQRIENCDEGIEFIDFDEVEGARSEILLPFDLHEMVEICEGNIVLVAGEFNAGKSGLALNILQMNKNRMRIRYLSSEMGGGELKRRFRAFGLPNEFWKPDEMTDYVKLMNNFQKTMVPDGLNIIDYLEFSGGDYTQGAEYLRQVHDKLTTGVAIVCIQQKEGARLPRSGDLVMEKPRLAISIKKIQTTTEDICGVVEIQKAKNVRLGKCDGKKLEFQILDNGSRFKVIRSWGWWR